MTHGLLSDLATCLGQCSAEKATQIRAQADRVSQALSAAISLWQAFLGAGKAEGDKFTAVLWLGSEASKQLHACHLEARAAADRLAELTGLPFADLMGMTEELSVVMAYDALRAGETVPGRAESAIATMISRRQALQDAAAS